MQNTSISPWRAPKPTSPLASEGSSAMTRAQLLKLIWSSLLALVLLWPLLISVVNGPSLRNSVIYQTALGAQWEALEFHTENITLLPHGMPQILFTGEGIDIGTGGNISYSSLVAVNEPLLFASPVGATGVFQFDAATHTYSFDKEGYLATEGSYMYFTGDEALEAMCKNDGIDGAIMQRIAWNALKPSDELVSVGYLLLTPTQIEESKFPTKREFLNSEGDNIGIVFLKTEDSHIAIYNPLCNSYGIYTQEG